MQQVSLGDALIRKIWAEGMTVAAAAQTLGVSRETVRKWENGSCLPSTQRYAALCCFLGISRQKLGELLKVSILRINERKTMPVKAAVSLWTGDAGLPSKEASPKPRRMKKALPGHLSDEQADALCCIARYTLALERAPWLDEIARDCRLDVDAVRRALKALEKAGFVKFRPVHFAITSKGIDAASQIEKERIRLCAFT